QRGWDCLSRFGERLAGFKRGQVRAVATQTLREARNRDQFLARADDLLGFPIDVISGREEARLIYQGVAHLLPRSNEKRLVVDIGGRSTELILGQAFDARVMESYHVGSVTWSLKHFPNGLFTTHAFQTAEIAAKAVLDEALDTYRRDDWEVAYGSSGTIGAVGDVLTGAGWPAGSVTREGLDWLLERMLKAQSADRLRLDGIKEDRRAVIGGGVSVLRAVFDLLGIETMQAAQGALRHGVLYALVDREQIQADVCAATVQRLARKFGVDVAQAQRVRKVAHRLFDLMHAGDTAANLDRSQHTLDWAAQLHEIGCHISHSDYHKHGAYILDNTDALGFAMPELHDVALLVLGHRGKLRKLAIDFEDILFVHQLLCLRLAVILCHARRDPDLEDMALATSADHQLRLTWRPGWEDAFPQSVHLLREEVAAWQKTPWTLQLAG
ncbi:MAG: Ppx/GppA phosphatase family protein, partial [Rhodoferax sp.]